MDSRAALRVPFFKIIPTALKVSGRSPLPSLCTLLLHLWAKGTHPDARGCERLLPPMEHSKLAAGIKHHD